MLLAADSASSIRDGVLIIFVAALTSATYAVVYLGIFPAALAYIAWSYVLNEISASDASLYLYAMPIISSLLGLVILHEYPSYQSICGGMLTLCGALCATGYISQLSFFRKTEQN